MSKPIEDQLRTRLEKLEVPKMIVWIDNETKVETMNLTEKTIDGIIDLFAHLASEVRPENTLPPQTQEKLYDYNLGWGQGVDTYYNNILKALGE
jgi:hypothetical protein